MSVIQHDGKIFKNFESFARKSEIREISKKPFCWFLIKSINDWENIIRMDQLHNECVYWAHLLNDFRKCGQYEILFINLHRRGKQLGIEAP